MEQLRLACLHPQMTQYWRGLANELQLAQVPRSTQDSAPAALTPAHPACSSWHICRHIQGST
jgi:hypothetical protein